MHSISSKLGLFCLLCIDALAQQSSYREASFKSRATSRRKLAGKKGYDSGGYYPHDPVDPCDDPENFKSGKKGAFNLYKYICAIQKITPQPTGAPTIAPSSAPSVTAPPTLDTALQCIPGVPGACPSGLTCFFGQCVTDGAFRFSIYWVGDADIDLALGLPNGNEISFTSSDPSTTGQFDMVTGNQTGSRENANIYVESIFFTDTPDPGTYALTANLANEAFLSNNFVLSVIDGNTTVQEDTGLFLEGAREQKQVYFFTL